MGIERTKVDFNEVWRREAILKANLIVYSPEEEAKAEMFRNHFRDSLHFSVARSPAYPGVDFINIVDPQVSKGKALEALAAYLGSPIGETMAVGDGTNDISLLSTAGLAVAMDNAPDEVKRVADYITLDVDQNGLAAAIKKFLF
jgi:HAD superfamily hydrolase (TIGR01484 family)